MTNVNFEEIKNQLISNGLIFADQAENYNQKVVHVSGEWRANGTALIKKTRAGWAGEGFFSKTIDAQISVPETSNFDESPIITALQLLFPDAKISVKID